MADTLNEQAEELPAGRGAALVFAVALLATVLMAIPVILSPSERIFGSGEILSREDPSRDALVVIDQFRTGRVPSPYLQPLTDLPGQALARLIGPVAAYNLLVLLSFPLSAAAAYLLARYVLASHLAAVVAGLAYAFLPFHVMQAGGHPHVAQTQWLPLYLLALWAHVDRPGFTRALLLLAAAAAASLADFYSGFIIAALSPIALLAYGMTSARPSTRSRGYRMGVTALVLIGAALAGFGAIRHFVPAVAVNPGASAFPRSELFAWSARWWSYLVPPSDHPIWGSAVREFWNRREVAPALLEHQQVSLGLSLVLLSLVPLWAWWRADRETASSRVAPALSVLAMAALLCSLSPERTIGSFTFVRPSSALYALAPMFRAYSRFGVVVGLMTALLAGAGAAMLWRRNRRGRAAAGVLLVFAALEYAPFPPWRSRDVLPTAAHRFLRSQPGPLRVLDCVDPLRLSDTLAASVFPHPLSLLGAVGLDDCGEPRLGEKLGALGYTRVIIRRNTPTGAWLAEDPPRFAASSALQPEVGFKDAWILSVKTGPSSVHLQSWSGFYPREYEAGKTWRWMAGEGTLRFASARGQSDTTLEIEMRSFPASRRVAWSVDGRKLGEIDVTPQWNRYELRLGTLSRGEFSLTLACAEPAAIAHDVLLNHDLRTLGLAVGAWRLDERDR